MTVALSSSVLIGRDDLLALADRRLAPAARRSGELLFPAGEAGIGKTRLLGEIVARARAAGFRTLSAGAAPGDTEIAAGLLGDLAAELRRVPGRSPLRPPRRSRLPAGRGPCRPRRLPPRQLCPRQLCPRQRPPRRLCPRQLTPPRLCPRRLCHPASRRDGRPVGVGRSRPPVGASILSARELEVARLVTARMTNREIATALTIAPETAAAHVEHIRTKLGFSRRAQIAAWIAAGGDPAH